MANPKVDFLMSNKQNKVQFCACWGYNHGWTTGSKQAAAATKDIITHTHYQLVYAIMWLSYPTKLEAFGPHPSHGTPRRGVIGTRGYNVRSDVDQRGSSRVDSCTMTSMFDS